METDDLGGRSDSNAPDTPAAEQRRLQTFCRQIFRDMVKHQVLEEPLSAYRRRLLVRYGASLGLEELESSLIVRAVEYECGRAGPDQSPDAEGTADPAFLAEIGTCRSTFLLAVVLLAGLLLGMTVLSLR